MSIDPRDVLKRPLTNGGDTGAGLEPCVMNAVHARWLIRQGIYFVDSLTDMPECTDGLIARCAQSVNDADSVNPRRLGEDIQVRLLLAHQPSDPEVARRVRLRVLLWAAESVQHLLWPEAKAVLELGHRWLDDPSSVDIAEVNRAYDTLHGRRVFASTIGPQAYAHSAAQAVLSVLMSNGENGLYFAMIAKEMEEIDLVEWLDSVLDAHEKARAEEGVLHE